MSNLSTKLDTLLANFQAKGFDPASNLNPGLSAAELDHYESKFGFQFPLEVRELYAWRNGSCNLDAEPEHLLMFRDMAFLSLDHALDARAIIEQFCSAFAQFGNPTPFAANSVLPIAGLEGQYYVVPCRDHTCRSKGPHPVVAIGEDLGVYFYSIESMLDTCNAWVSDSQYTLETLEPEDEIKAWERFNPGFMDEAEI